MADLEDVVQNVAIHGTDDITSAFKSIAAAADAAFGGIQVTIDQAFSTAPAAQSKLTDLGQTLSSLNGIIAASVAGFSALAVGIAAITKSAADAVTSLGRLAEETGTTISDVSGLVSAFADSGASTDGLALAFKRLSNSVANDWPAIQKNIKASADTIATSQLKVQDASLGVIEAQLKLSDSSQRAQLSIDESFENVKVTAQSLQEAFSNSVLTMQGDLVNLQGAALGVEAAQQALNTALGIPPSAAQKQQLAIEQAQLALAKALQAQREAAQKAFDDATKTQIAIEQAQLASEKANLDASEAVSKARIQQTKDTLDAQKAQLELNAALRAQNETLLADIPTIMREIQAITSGSGQLAQNFDLSKVSVDNLAKSIFAVAAKGDIIDGLIKPTGADALRTISTLFQHLEDNTIKTALAMKIFGRGVQQDMVDALSKGNEATQAYIDKLTKANLIITETDLAISQKLHNAFNTFANDLTIVAEKFALAFGPTILSNIQALDDALRSLTTNGSIQAFADGFAKVFQQFEDGIAFIVKNLKQMYDGLANIIGQRQAFALFVGVLTVIAAGVLLLLSPLIVWPIIIATIIIAIGALAEKWDAVKQLISDGVTFVTDFFKNSWNSAVQSITDAFTALGRYIASTWIGTVIAAIAKAAAAIKSLLSSSPSSAPDDSASQPPQFAGGGLIKGVGTTKSDSNIIAVSDREYVVQAPSVAAVGEGVLNHINEHGRIPGFADGGLVTNRAASPAAATSQRSLHLTIGGQTFHGLTVADHTVNALRQAALKTQLASNGRGPGWKS